MSERQLIVNADDFGLSGGVNAGVIEAHERGIVTSASLMVRWPAAGEAAAYARAHPQLSVGLHFDFGESICRDGTWVALYEIVDERDARAVAAESHAQLGAFRRLMGQDPTHLDSHQHAHLQQPVRSVLASLARVLGVPLRACGLARYCGDFYGQGAGGEAYPDLITVDALTRLLARLPAGVTELGCHPGYADGFESNYVDERAAEVEVLCDRRVKEAIAEERIQLISFAELLRPARAAGLRARLPR